MRADKIATPYRGFSIGLPGSAKTGGLAALANVGYKLRILDFDGNGETILPYLSPEAKLNVDIVTVMDRFRNGDKYVEPLGNPEAFNRANELLMEWKYKEEDGTEVNLGKSKDWGLDTILVVDSGSALAKSIMRRAIKMSNKTKGNVTSGIWGHAVTDFEDFVSILKGRAHHLIINVHKQMIGPQDFMSQGDDDAVKEKKLEAISQNLIPTRWYPIAVTKPQAQSVHGLLPIMVEFKKITKLGKEVRVIDTTGGMDIDVKVPNYGSLKREYPIETGMAQIFEALGYKAPGFGK